MKKLLLILLLSGAVMFHAEAQRIHSFVTAGGMLSQVEGDELKGFKQLGFTGGVGVLIDLTEKGALQADIEVLFAQRGAWNNTTDPYAMNLYLNYIDIPVMLCWTDPHGGMTLGAGVTYGRLVQQPHSTIYYNPSYFIPDTNMTFLKNDLAATVDLRFAVWRNLMFNLRWQYSVIPIRRDWAFAEYKNGYLQSYTNNAYNHAITLRLIWQF